MDQLTEAYYRRIRINQIDVYQHDSEANMLLNIDGAFEAFCAQDAINQKNADTGTGKNTGKGVSRVDRFQAWVVEEFGTPIKDPQRFLTVLGNDYWRSMARKFCGYSFGRQVFKIFHFEQAQSQMMPEVSELSRSNNC